jgi:hypothetical protein
MYKAVDINTQIRFQNNNLYLLLLLQARFVGLKIINEGESGNVTGSGDELHHTLTNVCS